MTTLLYPSLPPPWIHPCHDDLPYLSSFLVLNIVNFEFHPGVDKGKSQIHTGNRFTSNKAGNTPKGMHILAVFQMRG